MNTTSLNEALHITMGNSAGGALKDVLGLDSDSLLINQDPIHCGPAPATDDLDYWRSVRQRFIADLNSERRDISLDHYGDFSLLKNVGKLYKAPLVIVWAAQGLHEQLLLAWVVFLFDRLGLDPSTLRVVHFKNLRPRQQVLGMGELSPENIREFNPGPSPLGADELDEVRRAWNAYTSSDPAALSAYLAGPTCLPLLHKAMSRLIYRYPDIRSGLSLCDTWMLHQAIEHGPLPARIIGWTFAMNETPDQVGDDYLFDRLRRFGSAALSSPLVLLTGNTRSMRESRVEITDFGRKVLAGEANHVAENGIDDWIGGVHLTSDTVVFRDGDKLLLS